jgi:hypothetical protein
MGLDVWEIAPKQDKYSTQSVSYFDQDGYKTVRQGTIVFMLLLLRPAKILRPYTKRRRRRRLYQALIPV